MKENKQLRKQLFLHSKGWLSVAIATIIILSVYNIIVSWLLQKIIDIAAGTDSTPLTDVIAVSSVSFADPVILNPPCCSTSRMSSAGYLTSVSAQFQKRTAEKSFLR